MSAASVDAAGFTLSTNCPSWCVQRRCTGAHWGAEHVVPVVRTDTDRWVQPPEVIVGAHMDGEMPYSDHIFEVQLSLNGHVSWTREDPRDVDAGVGPTPG